jgi:phage-related protein
MTYPILPLTPTWGNTESFQADIAKSQYGNAGVELRSLYSINSINGGWEINVSVRNFQELDDFLRSRRGSPFRLSLDGGITDDGKCYICTDWQIQQVGMGVGSFSATINQVRRFVSPLFQIICNGDYSSDRGRILEFLPPSFDQFFTMQIVATTGNGVVEVHKWVNDLSTFTNRIWMVDMTSGGYFTFAPTAIARHFSFNRYNSTPSYKAILYLSITNNIILLDRYS